MSRLPGVLMIAAKRAKKKTRPLNSRQVRFVHGVTSGKTAKQAYIDAGYKSRGHAAEVGGSDLLRNPEIRRELDTLRKEAAERSRVDCGIVIHRLWMEATGIGYDSTSQWCRVRALELLGRHLGMFSNRPPIQEPPKEEVQWDWSRLSDEQLKQLNELLALARVPAHGGRTEQDI